MSYILDALKKSEQERLAGGVPGLHSGQPTPQETAAPRRNRLIPAALLLAINAGGIGWWLAARPAAPAHPPAPLQLVALPPVATAPQPTPAPAPAPPPAATRVEPPTTAPTPPHESIQPKPAVRTAPPTAGTTPPPEPDAIPAAPPRGGIVAYADLPASVRNGMPPLKISGYVDGAGEVMLVVDDRLVHEGDEIGPGVKVLKISPDGAVFGFRNYRFRR